MNFENHKFKDLGETKYLHLVRDPFLSVGNSEQSDNYIVQGDNDQAISLIRSTIFEKVKCIYLDPPYNNQENYTHYNDSDHHEIWLEKIVLHICSLKDLLTSDGSMWISIDDSQLHYLKVELDKVFGRKNFVATVVWEHRKTRENRKSFSNNHEYILVYAKDASKFKRSRNLLSPNEELLKRYKNPDLDPRGVWQSISLNVQAGHATKGQFYDFQSPNGKIHTPPKGRCWVHTKEKLLEEVAKNNIWFGKDGNAVPRKKKFLVDSKIGLTPQTIWKAEEVGTTDTAKKNIISLFPDLPVFDTPKPEKLLQRILEISTNPGDLVLDSFLGSGTTASVAIQIGRRFIGIEIGEQAVSFCQERLCSLIGVENSKLISDHTFTKDFGFDFYRVEENTRRL